MAKKAQVGPHVLKVIRYIKRLETLGFVVNEKLQCDLILQSLPDSYSPFIMNFNMNMMVKSMLELLNMLRTAKQDLKKPKLVLLVVTSKGKGKSKGKAKVYPKSKPKGHDALKPEGGIGKGGKIVCFYCGKLGH
ncbi:uncharacterized protein LOC116127678 [Pistacia vera]|uniref:uncharacterized protein LOC116127678 n=1 Tax=Pistacia vera TaxID=55513 RepID=UPI001263A2B9|nr:uncharacterized protein LOC116127678 [Pistacia vera]